MTNRDLEVDSGTAKSGAGLSSFVGKNNFEELVKIQAPQAPSLAFRISGNETCVVCFQPTPKVSKWACETHFGRALEVDIWVEIVQFFDIQLCGAISPASFCTIATQIYRPAALRGLALEGSSLVPLCFFLFLYPVSTGKFSPLCLRDLTRFSLISPAYPSGLRGGGSS